MVGLVLLWIYKCPLTKLYCYDEAAAPRNRPNGNSAGTPFIVGGQNAIPNEFPFMVTMQSRSGGNYVHRCGGAILADTWVVSASHCVEKCVMRWWWKKVVPTVLHTTFSHRSILARNTRIGAGLQSQTIMSGTEQYLDVAEFFMHPQYDTVTLENDIVLLKVTISLPVYKFQPISNDIWFPYSSPVRWTWHRAQWSPLLFPFRDRRRQPAQIRPLLAGEILQ